MRPEEKATASRPVRKGSGKAELRVNKVGRPAAVRFIPPPCSPFCEDGTRLNALFSVLTDYIVCIRRALLVCALFGVAVSGRAQLPRDTAVAGVRLGEAEVKALRKNEAAEAATPFQRLDSAAFRRMGITDTGDALRRMAGTNVRDYGGAGGLKTVSVRGLGAAHTAVSYDGLCLTDARHGSIDLSQFGIDRLSSVTLHTLDRQSLLCTVRELAAAVVDLRSAMPDTAVRGLRGNVALRAGEWHTYNPSLYLSKRFNGRLAANFAAGFFFAGNDYPFFVSNGVASTDARRENSRMAAWHAEAGATYRTRRGGTVATKLYVYHDARRLPGPVILYTSGNAEKSRDGKAFAQSRWERRKGAWRFQAALKADFQRYRYYDYGGKYPDGRYFENYRQAEVYGNAGAMRRLGRGFSLAYSTDASLTSLKSNLAENNRVNRQTWLQSLSGRFERGGAEVTLRGVFHLSADHARSAGDLSGGPTARPLGRHAYKRFTPAATLALRLPRRSAGRPVALTLRGGYKEMFRLPAFSEQYYYRYGQLQLRPELTRQMGGGATLSARAGRWLPELTLTLDAYHNRVADRIVFYPVNLHIWRAANLGRVRTRGFDGALNARLRLAKGHELFVAANYTFQKSTDATRGDNAGYGLQMPYTPLHSGAASVAYEGPWVNLSVHTTFCGERRSTLEATAGTSMARYAETGFALYRTFKHPFGKAPGVGEIELRYDLVNAFNERYEVVRRYPMPGRCNKVACVVRF